MATGVSVEPVQSLVDDRRTRRRSRVRFGVALTDRDLEELQTLVVSREAMLTDRQSSTLEAARLGRLRLLLEEARL